LGELKRSPRPLAYLRGPLRDRERGREKTVGEEDRGKETRGEREGKKRGGGEGKK